MKQTNYENKNTGKFTVYESDKVKMIKHKDLMLKFRKSDGYTEMSGNNEETYSPTGSFIADIEISTSCLGIPDVETGVKKCCSFCYKANSPTGTYMTIDTYKKVLNNLNQNNTITQVALGIDSEGSQNPDLMKILEYTRSVGIVPNLTLANLTDASEEFVKNLVKNCGAISVSKYDNKDVCYDTVKLLTDAGLEQVNLHFCIHSDNFDDALETLNDILVDSRLSNLNAIVFLSLKQKGRGIGFQTLSQDKFNQLYKVCMDNEISMGSDSCGSCKMILASKEYGNYEEIKNFVEPCESSRMSEYINVHGEFFPCSFIENTVGWKTGIDVTGEIDLLNDVWYNERTVAFRNKLLNNLDCNRCTQCPVYKI